MPEPTRELPNWDIQIISPGRVNLLGEHVDYNQGVVLPVAIDRFVHLAARERPDNLISITALDLNQTVEFSLKNLDDRIDVNKQPLPAWALYPAGVAWSLLDSGYDVRGLEAAITSNLPIGAGLSSSAAVELAYALAWQTIGGWQMDRMQLAKLCQFAENQYVGVNCGLMDQFACAHGVARHALYFDTRSLAWQPLPIPPETVIVIADSGIRRQLSNSAYNQRRTECERALQILQRFLPDIHSLRDVSIAQFNQFAHQLPDKEQKRARHVIEEIDRVRKACLFLVQEDARGFGELMVEGHASLRNLYEVSLLELDALVKSALEIEGCFGARLTGAGFGGCTVNLVNKDSTENFITQLKTSYQHQFGKDAFVFICQASRGVYILSH